MELNIFQNFKKYLYFIFLLMLVQAGFAANKSEYSNITVRDEFFRILQSGVRNEDRPRYFFEQSEERLNQFLLDENNLQSPITREYLQSLQERFHEDSFVGDGTDATLPLIYRDTVCYIKAFWAHVALLNDGVDDRFIRKFLLVGTLRQSEWHVWDYHIATAVKASDGYWYLIDLDREELMEAQLWLKANREEQEKFPIKKVPSHFQLSIRPAYQWTVNDDFYDLENIDIPLQKYIKNILAYEKGFGDSYYKYIKNNHLKRPLCAKLFL